METDCRNGSIMQDLKARLGVTGVYDEPNCMHKAEDLDHAVLLVGYGTTAGGKARLIHHHSKLTQP